MVYFKYTMAIYYPEKDLPAKNLYPFLLYSLINLATTKMFVQETSIN